MPSDDSLLCRMSGARPGIAPKVIRAFAAARRQLRGVQSCEDEGT